MRTLSGKNFVRSVLGKGRYSFTLDEAVETMGLRGQALNMALHRLKRDRWVAPFSRGFYLALDVQHQSAGTLDPEWFVDDWAKFVGAAYYVGGLSAAAIHGAAHQRPLAFQVCLNRHVRSVERCGVRLVAYYKRTMPEAAIERRKSPAGYFRASSPELTAYDLLAYERCCPSLDLAATVYVELGEAIDVKRLAALTNQGCRVSVLQRVGWLLDRTGWREKTDGLHEALGEFRRPLRPLDNRLPARSECDGRWNVMVNADVQPDVER